MEITRKYSQNRFTDFEEVKRPGKTPKDFKVSICLNLLRDSRLDTATNRKIVHLTCRKTKNFSLKHPIPGREEKREENYVGKLSSQFNFD